MPAYYCGVFGHKTTPGMNWFVISFCCIFNLYWAGTISLIVAYFPFTGLITTKGITFRTGEEGETMVCTGPMTRFAEDLTPFLKVLLDNPADAMKLDQKVYSFFKSLICIILVIATLTSSNTRYFVLL